MATLQAVVIGGTGACGKHLVTSLLQSKVRIIKHICACCSVLKMNCLSANKLSRCPWQESVSKVTLFSRRRLEELPGVDIAAEENEGRLLQHIEDLDSMSDDTVRQHCTGAHVFFNTLGTTRSVAGSAVNTALLLSLSV